MRSKPWLLRMLLLIFVTSANGWGFSGFIQLKPNDNGSYYSFIQIISTNVDSGNQRFRVVVTSKHNVNPANFTGGLALFDSSSNRVASFGAIRSEKFPHKSQELPREQRDKAVVFEFSVAQPYLQHSKFFASEAHPEGPSFTGYWFYLNDYIDAEDRRLWNESRTSTPHAQPLDIRTVLLDSARRSDPDFPAEPERKLTHFSHVGQLVTLEGQHIHVADRRAVIEGMSAPRGQNHIIFFDDQFQYLGKFGYVASRPLWFEGSRLYLFGNLDGSAQGFSGNVVDVAAGFDQVRVYRARAYGSSGSGDE